MPFSHSTPQIHFMAPNDKKLETANQNHYEIHTFQMQIRNTIFGSILSPAAVPPAN